MRGASASRWKRRLAYEWDKLISAGAGWAVLWLAALTAVVSLLAGAWVALMDHRSEGGRPLGLVEASWRSLMRTLDSGTMGTDQGWTYRIEMLVVTLAGILLVSTLIGVLTAGIESKLHALRRGRSQIVERGHFVILGWSTAVWPVVEQLLLANRDARRRAHVAVLADRDPVETLQELTSRRPRELRRWGRIICRRGSPTRKSDLALVCPEEARSVIVMAPGEGADGGGEVFKTLLALARHTPVCADDRHVVVEATPSAVKTDLRLAGGPCVRLVDSDQLMGRIIVQSSRQTGLSSVYGELLDFRGNEICTLDHPLPEGATFRETAAVFENAVVVGLLRGTTVMVHPVAEEPICRSDRLLVVALDRAPLRLAQNVGVLVNEEAIVTTEPAQADAEQVLILGWNRRGATIVEDLSHYVAAGSAVTVMAAGERARRDVERLAALPLAVSVTFRDGDPSSPEMLQRLSLSEYRHVIVLADASSPAESRAEADVRTLRTLLHLRERRRSAGEANCTLVSEMIDIRNHELAEADDADDFVVSDRLISLMMAQVAENRDLCTVMEQLLSPEGSEFYMRPIGDYVALGQKVSFATLAQSAVRRDEIAIGWRLRGEADKPPETVLNPPPATENTFWPGDKAVVIARR